MKQKFILFSVCLCMCLGLFWSCNESSSSPDPTQLVLFDFQDDFDSKQVIPDDATFEVVSQGDTRKLKVETGEIRDKPGVVVKMNEAKPWDLTGYYQVKADVENLGDEDIQVEMFVGDDPDGLIKWYCSDYIDLKPGESGTITVDLSWTQWVFDPQPEFLGMRGMPGIIKTDISKIDELSFYSRYATQANAFSVANVRAVGQMTTRDTADFLPFIDAYGQYIHRDWKGKIHADQDIKKVAQAEEKRFQEQPGPENRSQYGGWTAGPKLEATGFFRTEKHQGKWYMVDPEGYLFWSAGINCVATGTGITGIQGRENYFKDLPAEGSELGKFYAQGGWSSHGYYKDKVPFKAYQFYQANLYRKYGEDWHTKWQENVHKRYKNWGLNTIGIVSDNDATQMHKTPYTNMIWINGTPKIEGSDGYWGKYHDVFDPKFREAVHASMEAQKIGAGDPWCIGYFVDNELSWGEEGSLAMGALRSPASQAAKQEFIHDLKAKYNSIDKLNAQWGTHHASWDALLESTEEPEEAKAMDDLLAFYQKIAETYFRTIKEELVRIAPNQNYLGCRFAWANNDITVRAACKYTDIVSFNKYEYSVEKVGLPEGEDKAILIGEFHFGALDRGLFHAGVKKAVNQEQRGEMYESYIKGALRNDAIVGAHWFQFTDEATTGREDGENYNVGLVDVCDTPYEELLKKIRETTYGMYKYRSNN